MKPLTTNSLQQIVSRLICTVPLDGALGAACGALYGFVFGGFGALNHSQPWRNLAVTIHFTEWGLGIGALVGVVAAFLSYDESANSPIDSARDVAVIPLRMVGAIKAAGSDTPVGKSRQVLPTPVFETRASA